MSGHRDKVIDLTVEILEKCREYPVVILFEGEGEKHAYVQGGEIAEEVDDLSTYLTGGGKVWYVLNVNDPATVAEGIRILRDQLADGPINRDRVAIYLWCAEENLRRLMDSPQGNA